MLLFVLFRRGDQVECPQVEILDLVQVVPQFDGCFRDGRIDMLAFQIFPIFRNILQVQPRTANHQRRYDRAYAFSYYLGLRFDLGLRQLLFALRIGQFLISRNQLLECRAQILYSLKSRFAWNLEELQHGVDILGAIVEGRSSQQHDFVTHTEVVQYTVIEDILILVLVGFIHNNQKFFIRFGNHLIMFQSLFNLSRAENGSGKTELILILLPLLFQVRRANDDCTQS